MKRFMGSLFLVLVVLCSTLFVSVHGCNYVLVQPESAVSSGNVVPIITSAAGCLVTIVFRTGELTVLPDTDMLTMEIRPPGAMIRLESLDQFVFDEQPDADGVSVEFNAIFEWKPQLKDARFYEGLRMELASCTDPITFSIEVVKCRYCVNERDSLHSIAADFGTHWTQIWSSNPDMLLSPDTLTTGDELALGNIYTTQFGDTWKYLSVRFGVSIDSLRRLNPDMTTAAIIPGGLAMCVMPETCPERRPAVPGISW
mmetsp:Transcript_35926/g.72481  ORF Transcript_35926/g.72481 Transcript_35926/m.72481 type:complete len:256 (+) Transcript_35926:119-886(+)